MKKRHIKLLQLLNREEEYISGKMLAEILGVSVRTVRNDIRDLNESYLTEAIIESNNRFGYKICGEIRILKNLNEMDPDIRAFFIIKLLKQNNNWLTYQEIADCLWFSPQTISTDIQKIAEMIKEKHYPLTLHTETFRGVMLSGHEWAKRQLMASLAIRSFASMDECKQILFFLFEQELDQDCIDELIRSMTSFLQESEAAFNLYTWPALMIHVCIQLISQPVEHYEWLLDKNDPSLTLAETIVNALSIKKVPDDNASEIYYLASQIKGLKILPCSKVQQTNINELEHLTQQTLQLVGDRYGYELLQDDQLITGIYMHLLDTLQVLHYSLPVYNPYLNQIKSDYIQAYQMSIFFAEIMGKKMNIFIPEEEIGYLTLHIEAAIERIDTLSIHVGLLQTESSIISTLMRQKIEKNFKQIHIEDIYEWKDTTSIPDSISFLLSTQPIVIPGKKILVVNPILQQKDISKIKQTITPNVIQEHMEPAKFIYLNEKTKQGFLKAMTEEFNLEPFFEGIMDRENLSSTEIGNKIAIPHPLFSAHVPASSIYIGVNARELDWGNSNVKVVFLIILSEKDELRYEYIYREIYQIMKYRDVMDRLMKVKTYEDFIQLL